MEASEPLCDLLDLWFGPIADDGSVAEEYSARWFRGGERFDALLSARYRLLLEEFITRPQVPAVGSPRERLAWVLMCDQVVRNVYRGTPRAYALDTLALELCQAGFECGDDQALHAVERYFLYMPLTHTEQPAIQRQGVGLFTMLAQTAPAAVRELLCEAADYAREHCEVIERFGRFPHRNTILGRVSTPEELAFIQQGGMRL